MKITILAPDLSTNCLGRALVLAETLALDHEVRVVGSRFGSGLWPPAEGHPIEIVETPGGIWPRYLTGMAALRKEISGQVVVAVKPRVPSLGLALLARRRTGIPVVLDIDDEETALRPLPSNPFRLAQDLLNPDGGGSRRIMARAIPHADAIVTASSGLNRRYGGELVWHAKDTDLLSPQRDRRTEWREKLGLGPEPVVLFLGTPRPWKGVEDAAQAVGRVRQRATLLVVGADDTPYSRKLAGLPWVQLRGMVPLGEMPGVLEAADVVVIPQRMNAITRVQMPSKLFDAMAMAKPIVSTDVSDIGMVLADGRGITVPPGSVESLRRAVETLLDSPALGREMGIKARGWCVANASIQASRAPMARALEKAVGGGKP
jgi:glycosyltransferase involved in cell wall biosynthesis